MMEALDKTPKPAAVIKTQDDDSFILNEDPLLMVSATTCHSTPSKKQHERYGRSRNSSLPSTDKPKKRSSSYSHSYDRQNSLDSELDQGCSNQSILKEKRLEFERRREQVSLKCHSYLPTTILFRCSIVLYICMSISTFYRYDCDVKNNSKIRSFMKRQF